MMNNLQIFDLRLKLFHSTMDFETSPPGWPVQLFVQAIHSSRKVSCGHEEKEDDNSTRTRKRKMNCYMAMGNKLLRTN
uniref:Uncharacterized protein n=1 Tax=Magallana gigas TaxID=29159 RepID=K1PM28_MAGGI